MCICMDYCRFFQMSIIPSFKKMQLKCKISGINNKKKKSKLNIMTNLSGKTIQNKDIPDL